MKRQLIIRKKHWQAMLDHVKKNVPLESCGLLAGKNDRVENVIFVQNQARSAVRFVMDPYEQLRAFQWMEANSLDLVGIFHSHPTGPEVASATDIAEAAYEVVYLIWSPNQENWLARGFWIKEGAATEIPLQIVE